MMYKKICIFKLPANILNVAVNDYQNKDKKDVILWDLEYEIKKLVGEKKSTTST